MLDGRPFACLSIDGGTQLHTGSSAAAVPEGRAMSITLVGLLVLLIVGAICGVIAEMLVGFSVGGFFASAVVGFLGAFIGTWLGHALHAPTLLTLNVEGHPVEIVWSILGAVVLLLVLSVVRRGSRRRALL